MSVELTVRPYRPADREALFQIAADTAYFGDPIEVFMEDRRVFLNSFYTYYTDMEPEHCWVACADEKLAGFLTGCTDTKKQEDAMQHVLIPEVWGKVLRGKYHPGIKTYRYMVAMWLAERRHETTSADLSLYPAHLHINVDAAWRGYGLGKRLIQAYLNQLVELGIPGVHLGTTSRNVTACKLYESVGFKLVDARPTRMWRWLFKDPIENRSYAMRLAL
jgi:ribosomal protein S18 acetylase RimI-like enzyme